MITVTSEWTLMFLLQAHYEGECQHYPQPCSQCGQPVKRRDLDEHKENNCTFEQCKGCPILVRVSSSLFVVTALPYALDVYILCIICIYKYLHLQVHV